MYATLKTMLREAGIENPELESRIILRDVGGFDETDILLDRLPQDIPSSIQAVIHRRVAGEPLSRILGYREFYGRRFYLNRATLDPRADSETVIEAALNYCRDNKIMHPKILDLGTGSGCLLLTLLAELPQAQGVGVDLSQEALVQATLNAKNLNLLERVNFIQSNWWENVEGMFDIIISNPPYIRSNVIPNLESSVKNHDPILALDGGVDGLDAYKILLSNLKNHLATPGVVLFEIGFDQADDMVRLVDKYGATLGRVHHDLGGQSRVVQITYGDK